MGTTYWQFNDNWPVVSGASVDWCLRWKALHYMAKRFYAPLLASVSDDAEGLRLWATSDLAEAVKGQWTAEAWTYAGRRVWRKSGRFALAGDESRAVAALAKEKILELAGGTERAFLVVEVRAAGQRSTNTYNFTPLRAVELAAARIRATVSKSGDGFAVRLVATSPAFHVELSTGMVGGVFSDNIFTLLPGRVVTVRFAAAKTVTLAALKKSLKVRSVRETY
jgi:beta-mannosidase